MAHHWPDEVPPKPPALPPAVALPGGPDGVSGPMSPPGAGELGFEAWWAGAVSGLVQAMSAAELRPSDRSVGGLGPNGSPNSTGRAAAPAATIAAKSDPDEPGADHGAGVSAVDTVAGNGHESTAPATGVTALLAPTTEAGGPAAGAARAVVGVCWTVAAAGAARAVVGVCWTVDAAGAARAVVGVCWTVAAAGAARAVVCVCWTVAAAGAARAVVGVCWTVSAAVPLGATLKVRAATAAIGGRPTVATGLVAVGVVPTVGVGVVSTVGVATVSTVGVVGLGAGVVGAGGVLGTVPGSVGGGLLAGGECWGGCLVGGGSAVGVVGLGAGVVGAGGVLETVPGSVGGGLAGVGSVAGR
jgi:hypothetical protein